MKIHLFQVRKNRSIHLWEWVSLTCANWVKKIMMWTQWHSLELWKIILNPQNKWATWNSKLFRLMFFFSLVIHLGPKCLARVACDLNLVMIFSLASKWQVLKVGMPVFQPLYELKLKAFWSQWRYHDPI